LRNNTGQSGKNFFENFTKEKCPERGLQGEETMRGVRFQKNRNRGGGKRKWWQKKKAGKLEGGGFWHRTWKAGREKN